MKSRVAIVAAMAREIDPLVRQWKLEPSPQGVTVRSSEGAIAVFAGMGQERAEIAAQMALSFGPVHRLISAGWAGGIHPGMTIGAVRFASVVIDATTGERFATEQGDASEVGAESAVVVTTDRVVSGPPTSADCASSSPSTWWRWKPRGSPGWRGRIGYLCLQSKPSPTHTTSICRR